MSVLEALLLVRLVPEVVGEELADRGHEVPAEVWSLFKFVEPLPVDDIRSRSLRHFHDHRFTFALFIIFIHLGTSALFAIGSNSLHGVGVLLLEVLLHVGPRERSK